MMDASNLIAAYARRVEDSLIQDCGARGDSLAEIAQSVAFELPEDLKALLLEVAGKQEPGRDDTGSDVAAVAFAFQCGQLLERLDQFRRSRAAENVAFIDTDGRTVSDPERADLDRLSRFMVLRDRLLRKAADFSLKVLVTAVMILVVGFALGLI
jgi:hypothetical protein